jgi:nicotinamide riboside kinase
MLVSFTGAQCTGKTTLLKRCKCDVTLLRDWSYVDEVTRKVKRGGSNINEAGDDTTQLFILSEHLNNHQKPVEDQNRMLDRCILDGYIYTRWLFDNGKVSEWVLDYARNLMSHLIDNLDIIFYTQPEDVPLISDGVRSVNVTFRQDILDLYEQLFAEKFHWMNKLVRLRGTVNDRMKTILNKIDEKTNIRQ